MNKRMSIGAMGLFIFFAMNYCFGQDIHFSQYTQSPFNLNPGLTGQFNGTYRIVSNQRTQWRSVTLPYSTFGISVDAPSMNKIPISTGLSFYTDKTGDSRLSTTMVNLALSKSIFINHDESSRITPGIMLGLTSMKIDYSQLNYDNQWNGMIYDPGLSSGESFPRSARTYFNFHLGTVYQKTWSNKSDLRVGLAAYNLGAPQQSFFNDGTVRLDVRSNFFATYRFALNDTWLLAPSMIWMTQGKYKETDIGGNAEYVINQETWNYRSVYGGVYARAKDAGFIVAGMKYDEWNVGLSYDINTSNLRPASNARGGLEISVIYIAPPQPKAKLLKKVCPDYI